MGNTIIVDIKNKGKGLLALRQFGAGDILFNLDFSKAKNTIKESAVSQISNKNREHLVFIGNGKFVLDYSITSFINHSCNSNLYIKYLNHAKYNIIAKRPIQKNEELTLDYALDQGWRQSDFLCNCKSKKCRKKVVADFFKLSKKVQKDNLIYAAPWIKRKYTMK